MLCIVSTLMLAMKALERENYLNVVADKTRVCFITLHDSILYLLYIYIYICTNALSLFVFRCALAQERMKIFSSIAREFKPGNLLLCRRVLLFIKYCSHTIILNICAVSSQFAVEWSGQQQHQTNTNIFLRQKRCILESRKIYIVGSAFSYTQSADSLNSKNCECVADLYVYFRFV